MCDMSLDQFKSHDWSFNPISTSIYYSNYHRNARNSFSTEGFRVENLQRIYLNYPQNSYDQLNWFGFSYGYEEQIYRYQLRGQVSGVNISSKKNPRYDINYHNEAELEEVVMKESSGGSKTDPLSSPSE